MIVFLKLAATLITLLAGALIQSMCGFGMGVINICVFPRLFASVSSAMMLSCMLGASSATVTAVRLRRSIQWKFVLLPICGYVIPCTLAVFFSASVTDKLLIRALGVFLMVLGGWYLLRGSSMRIKPTGRNAIIAGVVSGLLAGFFAAGGPPMAIYYSSLGLEKEEYVGTTQAFFTFSIGYTVVCRILSGAFRVELLPYFAVGFAGVFAGGWIGLKLLKKASPKLIRTAVYVFVIISGLTLLF